MDIFAVVFLPKKSGFKLIHFMMILIVKHGRVMPGNKLQG